MLKPTPKPPALAGRALAGKRPFPFHIITPTQTAVLTQHLVIPHKLNQLITFSFHHFCCPKRPFPFHLSAIPQNLAKHTPRDQSPFWVKK
ncbi:MAG: hypothetical protein IAF02_29065 [Anaerolineae bacterium]|nr:hypothetical protein [Anaerolineae bacterium]